MPPIVTQTVRTDNVVLVGEKEARHRVIQFSPRPVLRWLIDEDR